MRGTKEKRFRDGFVFEGGISKQSGLEDCLKKQALNKNLRLIRDLKNSKQSGITMIALIITIIVMIVLASVSINAIVGDNGIITQAQNATIQNSIANLEEYLQELYVENYDTIASGNYSTKLEGLSNLESYKNYFYSPYTVHGVSNLNYIVTSDGYALYLINKSELPKEIQEQLIGGDTGDGEYSDYATLNDVYGVTSDLKVYYCSDGINSIIGLTVADLDVDNPARKVTISDGNLASILESLSYITRNEDGTFSAQELRSITELTITLSNTGLTELYNLSNLQKIYFEDVTLTTLSGIENCPKLYYVYNKGSTLGNYTAVGKLGSQLEYLYFYNITDSELETACSKTVGIGSYNLPNLTYFAVVGNTSYISSTTFYTASTGSASYSSTKSTNIITSLEPLNNLTNATKKVIQYMSLQNNNITSLSYLNDFTGLILLRAEYNSLSSLAGIEDVTSLQYLCVAYNNLTSLTTFEENSKLNTVSLEYNSNLTTLSGLENCSSLYCLAARGCNFGYELEVATGKFSTDSLVSLYEKINLYCLDLRSSSNLIWIDYISECGNLKYLRLDECTGMLSTSVYEIKDLIIALGSNASYPGLYALALLDDNTTYLDLTGETLTEDEFETIANYTKITHLSLKNVVITESEENEEGGYDEITNISESGETTNELDNLVTEVLSKLTAMKYLQVYGMSNLSTIDYVENMESLIELDVRDTSITDLSLLEEMTENMENKGSTFSLKTLAVNVEGTDLSEIPKTVSNLGSKTCFWIESTSSYQGGLLCSKGSIYNTLNGTDITYLYVGYSYVGFDNVYVDLTSCSKLISCEFRSTYNKYFILPDCVSRVVCRLYVPIFSDGTHLNYLSIDSAGKDSWFENVSGISICDSLYLGTSSGFLSTVSYFEDWSIETLNVATSLDDDLTGFVLPCSITSLNFSAKNLTSSSYYVTLENFPDSIISSDGTNLEELTINGTSISSLKFLNELENLEIVDLSYNYITTLETVTSSLSNVTSLNLSYNNLNSLWGIQYFTGLQTLDISYNTTLGDTASYNGRR